MFPTAEEIYIRLGFFITVLAAMGTLERTTPRRELVTSKGRRWFSNLSISIIDSVSVRWTIPVAATGMAILSAERGWGIFHMMEIPGPAAGLITLAVLDLIIYLQHFMFHHVPLFWRVHRMHHTDLDIDVTTGVRFHPFEILLSMGIKIAAVAALGPPPWSILVFEVLLNATSLFNHSNVFIPSGFDRVLRLLVVTPDMHRVHHSVIIKETNSNFGFNFPWWDRLFGTYRAQPVKGHTGMVIGLADFRDPEKLTLLRLLAIPFR
ncbi:MAG: sterol desaturase family protein [Nitrospiraceae bacterium]|nr:MAG: sterol desaturase family protein [Nitrospiraceae bacterium]